MQYILEKDGRFFYREDHEGELVCCYEIVVDWRPFGGKYTVYAFTPDDLHVYQVETGRKRIGNFNILQMDLDLIQPGMSCTYNGSILEYIDESHVSFDGRKVSVEADTEYTYKIQKGKIKARNGARGLYRFFDLVAEEGKYKACPFWCPVWWKFFELYAPKKG